MDGHTYLVNEHSGESAGWYTDQVAGVLLRRSPGWHRADPETGARLDPDLGGESDSAPDETTSPVEGGSGSAPSSSGTGRTRKPPQAVSTPGGGNADEPKE